MKKLIILFFVFLSTISFSQKEIKKDTTQICFPTQVGRQIERDLNELDKLRELKKLTDHEISELEKRL